MTRSHLHPCLRGAAPVVLLAALCPAAAADGPTNERVSLGSGSLQTNNPTVDGPRQWAVSADGRFVVFRSAATNLDPSDPDGDWDVYLRDTWQDTTLLVSASLNGAPSNGTAWECDVSDDGRYVVFASSASNLVAGDGNGTSDVFLRDVALGTTVLVSRTPGGAAGSGDSRRPSISADGGRVVFDSAAPDLDPVDGNGFRDVFLYERGDGSLRALSVTAGGATGSGQSAWADLSPDGGWVAFESGSTDLGPADPNNLADVYVHGVDAGTFQRISGPSGSFDQASRQPRISEDGRFVAFVTAATNLLPGNQPFAARVVRFERATGSLVVASRSTSGALGDGSSTHPAISNDGAFVAFTSRAANLVPADGNSADDVFVRQVEEGWTERVSLAADGSELPVASRFPALSGPGRLTGFHSVMPTVVPGDTNNSADLFLRDRGHDPGFAGSTYCDSAVNSSGAVAHTVIRGNPRLSAQDLTLATGGLPPGQFGFYFTSMDTDLVPGFGASQGVLCLGGSIVRIDQFILNSGPLGRVELPLPLAQLPPGASFAVGERWNFQYWTRDALPGGAPTSNTSDAACMRFL